ncbi:MAG: response regulator [Verrucomicrobiota bacterium]
MLPVLIIEDNLADARYLERMLKATGIAMEIQLADSLNQDPTAPQPGLVFLDINLPGSRGKETVTQGLELFPASPIIILTGISDDELAQESLLGGVQDFIMKGSYTPRSLEKSVRYAVNRHELKQSIENEKRHLGTILESVGEGLLLINHEGQLVFSNRAADQLLEKIGLPQDTRDWPFEDENPRQFKRLQHLSSESGREMHLEYCLDQVEWQQETHQLVTLRDNTERETLQRRINEKQKMEAVGQLSAGVAHEFNNLLAVIQLGSEILRMDPQNQEVLRETTSNFIQTCERGKNLVRQLMTFNPKQSFRKEPVDLCQFLDQNHKLYSKLLGASVLFRIERPEEPVSVEIDRGALNQIFANLCINARDAMPQEGELTVTLTTQLDPPDSAPDFVPARSDWTCMSYRDTGIGMAEEVRSRVFEAFFTTKIKTGGHGLGLSAVYNIVRDHQGFIEVESQEGRGATFRVWLPRIQSPFLGKQTPEPRMCPLPDGEKASILVCEDDPLVRKLVCKMLEMRGYLIHSAGNGAEALSVLKGLATPPDLLVTDYVMPDMNGLALAKALVEGHPGSPVIVMSAYEERLLRTDHQVPEEFNFILKPFEMREFVNLVESLLHPAVY